MSTDAGDEQAGTFVKDLHAVLLRRNNRVARATFDTVAAGPGLSTSPVV